MRRLQLLSDLTLNPFFLPSGQLSVAFLLAVSIPRPFRPWAQGCGRAGKKSNSWMGPRYLGFAHILMGSIPLSRVYRVSPCSTGSILIKPASSLYIPLSSRKGRRYLLTNGPETHSVPPPPLCLLFYPFFLKGKVSLHDSLEPPLFSSLRFKVSFKDSLGFGKRNWKH